MVHNGIEYGVMAAYAEGLGVLRGANIGKQADLLGVPVVRPATIETTALGAAFLAGLRRRFLEGHG